MKKGIVICVCLAVLLGLAACGMHATPDDNTTQNTASEGSAPSSTVLGQPIEPLPTMNLETIGQPVEYDPDRQIYILTGNFNNAIPDYGFPLMDFYILSKEALDPDTITLDIPVESPYNLSVEQLLLEGIALKGDGDILDQCGKNQYPYVLYQVSRGVDFGKLAQMEWTLRHMKEEADSYWEEYSMGKLSLDEYNTLTEPYNMRKAELEAYQSDYADEYCGLTLEDLPQFYVYRVEAYFPVGTMIEETFHQVDIAVNGIVYHQDVGEVQLRREIPYPVTHDWEIGGGLAGILGEGTPTLPYNGGYHRVANYFSFTAEWAMLLTELVLEEPEHRLCRVWVEITSIEGLHSEFYWDMSQPLQLYEGDQVYIDIEYYDPAAQTLDYDTRVWGYLIYEYDGGVACKSSECWVQSNVNFYELYAIIFEGLDLKSYYWDYYYPLNEPWRFDIAE